MKNINLRSHKSVTDRREALEKLVGISLRHISNFSLDEAVASGRNCENMIGAAQIPLGVAGPLRLASLVQRKGSGQGFGTRVRDKSLTKHDYYIPLATTEGALVASVNRGCKAIAAAGGATVAVETVGATRAPVFATGGLEDSLRLKQWLNNHFDALDYQAQQTSGHIALRSLDTYVVGKNVYTRLHFDTQDAMGMNMATVAAEAIARYVEQETDAVCVSVAGNMDVDKKAAFLNYTTGRGHRVWAEALMSAAVLQDVLKTTAQKLYEVWLAKCMVGSAAAGSMGFNAHYANVVAALFAATGQDPAHVVEGSLGITTTEAVTSQKSSADLYISVYLPALMVGTVGGGTGLATQQEALELLGIAGGNRGENAATLARIVGAAVLAGEVSLLASLAQGSLGRAHNRLARSKDL